MAAQFTLDFFSDTGGPLSLPLDAGGTVSTLTGMIPAGGLHVVKATNAGDLKTGWAQLTVTGPISGTAIFGLESPGQSDSEAAVPVYASESLPDFPGAMLAYPSAQRLAVLARDQAGKISDTLTLEPIYLREPHITVPKEFRPSVIHP